MQIIFQDDLKIFSWMTKWKFSLSFLPSLPLPGRKEKEGRIDLGHSDKGSGAVRLKGSKVRGGSLGEQHSADFLLSVSLILHSSYLPSRSLLLHSSFVSCVTFLQLGIFSFYLVGCSSLSTGAETIQAHISHISTSHILCVRRQWNHPPKCERCYFLHPPCASCPPLSITRQNPVSPSSAT